MSLFLPQYHIAGAAAALVGSTRGASRTAQNSQQQQQQRQQSKCHACPIHASRNTQNVVQLAGQHTSHLGGRTNWARSDTDWGQDPAESATEDTVTVSH